MANQKPIAEEPEVPAGVASGTRTATATTAADQEAEQAEEAVGRSGTTCSTPSSEQHAAAQDDRQRLPHAVAEDRAQVVERPCGPGSGR